MKRYEALEPLFGKVDLSFAEAVLNESYHVGGSRGRLPRSPLGVFKAHLLRRLRHVPSDRQQNSFTAHVFLQTSGILLLATSVPNLPIKSVQVLLSGQVFQQPIPETSKSVAFLAVFLLALLLQHTI